MCRASSAGGDKNGSQSSQALVQPETGEVALERRRIWSDVGLIETYKILTGKDKVSKRQFLCLHPCSEHSTRGHSLKVATQR